MQRKQGSAVDSAPLFFSPFIHAPEIHPYTPTPLHHTPQVPQPLEAPE